jgi:hypothetical protein
MVVFGGLVLLHHLSACFHLRYYKSFKSGLAQSRGIRWRRVWID